MNRSPLAETRSFLAFAIGVFLALIVASFALARILDLLGVLYR